MATLTSLLLAREALLNDRETFAQGSNWRPTDRMARGPYYWCSKGWERNDFNGYGWGVSNALRAHVPDGDLTRWWMAGRSKKELLGLFKAAIEEKL